jgi:hypothetical protein
MVGLLSQTSSVFLKIIFRLKIYQNIFLFLTSTDQNHKK